MRFAIFLLVLLSVGLPAKDLPPLELLRKVAARYANLHTFSVEADTAVHYGGSFPTDLQVPVSLVYSRPDKFRIETKHPAIAILLISSAGTILEYRGWQNEFNRSNGAMSASFSPELGRGGAIGEMLYDTIATGVASAVFQRREILNFEGRSRKCVVLQVQYHDQSDSLFTFWIDERQRLILRRTFEGPRLDGSLQTTISTIRSLKFDVPLPEDLFQFVPPEGAREVDSVPAARMARWNASPRARN